MFKSCVKLVEELLTSRGGSSTENVGRPVWTERPADKHLFISKLSIEPTQTFAQLKNDISPLSEQVLYPVSTPLTIMKKRLRKVYNN